MFGWHVHEKAILLVTIPMAVLAVMNPLEARSYVILNFVGNFSLFPLLHEDRETVIKVFLLFFNHVITITSLQHKRRSKKHTQSVTCLQYCYLIMCVPLFFLCRYFYLISETLEFLPLMIYSLYCSIGILTEFLTLYKHFINVSV